MMHRALSICLPQAKKGGEETGSGVAPPATFVLSSLVEGRPEGDAGQGCLSAGVATPHGPPTPTEGILRMISRRTNPKPTHPVEARDNAEIARAVSFSTSFFLGQG